MILGSMGQTECAVLFLCFLLILPSAESVPPRLTTTTSPDYGGTLSILCEISPGNPTTSIEIGKGAQPNRYSSSSVLALIGNGNQITNHAQSVNIGIDGHLDSTTAEPSFLKVDIHNVGCTNDGWFYCKVSSTSGTYDILNTSVTVCGEPAQISVDKPVPSDPTRFVVTCDVTPNTTSAGNVTYIALHRVLSSHSDIEPIAFANITSSGSQTELFANFTASHVRASGGINESDPENSKLEVEFDTGTCGDAGEYTCTLVYSEPGSDEERLALSHMTVDDPCDSNCFTAQVAYPNSKDPFHFTVSCDQRIDSYNRYCDFSGLSYLDQEISVLTPSRRQRQLAYFDNYNSNRSEVIHPDYRHREILAKSGSNMDLSVEISDGTCADSGTYRCKMVYIPQSARQPVVLIAETTVPACAPGAIANVTSTPSPQQTFQCTVDPTIVSELISLEISAVVKGHRTVLVFLNDYINNGRPEVQISEGHFSVDGRIDLDNPESSFLSLATRNASKEDPVTTTCKAVFLQAGTASIVQSFADQQFRLF